MISDARLRDDPADIASPILKTRFERTAFGAVGFYRMDKKTAARWATTGPSRDDVVATNEIVIKARAIHEEMPTRQISQYPY